MLTPGAIRYALRELARRAGVSKFPSDGTGFEELGLTVQYGAIQEIVPRTPSLVVMAGRRGGWRELIGLPPRSLEFIPLEGVLPPGSDLRLPGPLPVLFRGADSLPGQPFARREGSVIIFECDIVSATGFLLTRWEEQENRARDEHDRFPGEASVAFRQGFLDRPIVDEYALVLREWLKVLRPEWRPTKRRFSVMLSHDVDVVQPYRHLSNAGRALLAGLIKRRSLRRARQTCRKAFVQAFTPWRSPSFRGIERLAELSTRYGHHSAFYFMTADPSRHDSGYDASARRLRRCIHSLRQRGFEIGLHPGYKTFDNPSLLQKEKARLDQILGETSYGGRQHFLRFRIPDTWRDWEDAGLAYDSTLSYVQHEGFRCGTCHPFKPFDLQRERQLQIWEIPLIVMDGTLRQHRRLIPEEGRRRILELAARCSQVEGVFTLLWHNSSLHGDWATWAQTYEGVVDSLATMARESERNDTNQWSGPGTPWTAARDITAGGGVEIRHADLTRRGAGLFRGIGSQHSTATASREQEVALGMEDAGETS